MTLTFQLDDSFIAEYVGQQPKWGPVGYVTYKRTYARDLDKVYERHTFLGESNGLVGSEEFWLTLVRVVEGTFSILQDHCKSLRLPWNPEIAQRKAQEMYLHMWNFRFLPPGRGLWMMGAPAVAKVGGACLNNCGFQSTQNIATDFSSPFCALMDFSMLGVGVGGDVRGAGKITIKQPTFAEKVLTIEDTREGWVNVLRRILDAFVGLDTIPMLDYSGIRPAGTPIRGFGGTASGPGPLQEMVKSILDVLHARVGQTITSSDIVDIFNLVGRCVVAGNVRRCLPEGALVHTKGGLVPIERIAVGTEVLTSDGYHQVTEAIRQGTQQLVTVTTQMGEFRCTPNHRVAVMTAPRVHVFKQAQELVAGDRLVFVEQCIPGLDTTLPSWKYIKPEHSTTCQDITIPELDARMGWFLGMVAGDGYVFANRENNGMNGCVMVAVGNDEYHDQIAGRVREAFTRFSVNYSEVEPKAADNCRKIRASSKQLAWYFDEHFKQPRIPLRVPRCVLEGRPEVRGAYVAGLLDADGCVKTRPAVLVTSAYPAFLKEVQSVYASLGIPTRLFQHRPAQGTWQALYNLTLVGEDARARYRKLVQPFAVKKIANVDQRSGNDFGYPAKWVMGRKSGINYQQKWSSTNGQMTTHTYTECGGVVGDLIPVTVLEIGSGAQAETYDLSVEGVHEFVVDGLLVHNSAEIMFGEPDDDGFLELKDKEKFAAANDSHRWASNNSIFAAVGQSYNKVAKQTSKNGEPGYFWLENARQFGRMGDPADGKDVLVSGGNPCQAGWATVLTPEGIRTFDDIDVGSTIWSGQRWTTVTAKVATGVKAVFGYHTAFGTFYGTEQHRVVENGVKVQARDAVAIDVCPLPEDIEIFEYEDLKCNSHAITLIEDMGEHDVYDITVDAPEHTYWTGGLLVSNCLEQSLHDGELCNLVETFPFHHKNTKEFIRTLKFAYLYAKAVTLVPTHNPRTNAVTMKNRRIGCSMSGIVQAMAKFGRRGFLDLCDEGFAYILALDKEYSDWLCVPMSIKHTSVKPSGTISLLCQATPGIHHPHSEYYWRVIRFATDSKMLPALRAAGHRCVLIDPAKEPNTTAVYFPVKVEGFERGERDVSMWEQLELAAALQAHWANNQVSVTVKFDKKTEGPQIARALELYETRLKGVSFLPHGDHGYDHMPYQEITKEEYEAAIAELKPLDLSRSLNEVQDSFCDGDKCVMPVRT